MLSGDGWFRLATFWLESSLDTGRAILPAAAVPANSGRPPDSRKLVQGRMGFALASREEEKGVSRQKTAAANMEIPRSTSAIDKVRQTRA